jgi:hypothetical protein
MHELIAQTERVHAAIHGNEAAQAMGSRWREALERLASGTAKL